MPLIIEAKLTPGLKTLEIYLENLFDQPIEVHGIKLLNNDPNVRIPFHSLNQIEEPLVVSGSNQLESCNIAKIASC